MNTSDNGTSNISHIKLRGFKSFKSAKVEIPRDFTCIAGPNGSGKSNLCDAIRFALGEKSLKALRVRKIKELICANHRHASVEILLKFNGKQYEIRRVIREDGKVLYKLNGKRTRRFSIIDLLRKYNIDESGRNIIAQGQVQRVVEMSGKERREFIDSAVGISEYEKNKSEAMSELEKVERNINDGMIVVGEREAALKELEQQKEDALRYIKAKKDFTNAKVTLLQMEREKLEDELERVVKKKNEIKEEREKKKKYIEDIERIITDTEKEKNKFLEEIKLREKKQELLREIEVLKTEIASKEQTIKEKTNYIEVLKQEDEGYKKELEEETKKITILCDTISDLERKLSQLESHTFEDQAIAELEERENELKRMTEEILEKKGKMFELISELKTDRELLEIKRRALSEMDIEEVDVEQMKKEHETISKSISTLEKDMEAMYEKERDINERIGENEKKTAKIKSECMALQEILETTHKTSRFVKSLKEEKNIDGIYGMVCDFLKVDNAYTTAVEISAGNRLFYYIVDDITTATKVIEYLKKNKVGRITLIPLKEINVQEKIEKNSILNILHYPEHLKKAFMYVFGDTVLVKNAEEAKGDIGKYRMVTLEGELFERSGLMSGGYRSTASSILRLKAIEEIIVALEKEKKNLQRELVETREFLIKLRNEKAGLEVKGKTIAIELDALEKKRREMGEKKRKAEQLRNEADIIEKGIEEKEGRIKVTTGVLRSMEEEYKRKKEIHEKLGSSATESVKKAGKKKEEILSKKSSLRSEYETKKREIQIREENCEKTKKQLENLRKNNEETKGAIEILQRELELRKKKLNEKERTLIETGKEFEEIFKKIREMDERIGELNKEKGNINYAIEKLIREEQQIEIKKATTETRLADVLSELSGYKDANMLEMKKEELLMLIKESGEILNSITNVNLTAPELYEKKKEELNEINERIRQLRSEKEKIITIINDIEEKKKDAFFQTFQAVSEKFAELFKITFPWEGTLYLNKPNTPFESGLFISIKKGEREYVLESLSGGEKSLLTLIFLFSLQFVRPVPFYVLDEVDAHLDKENSAHLAKLITKLSEKTQFIVVTHNDIVLSSANVVFGVAKKDNLSRIVGIKMPGFVQ